METYDLIVVGSGAASIVVDAALRRGLRIAFIERAAFGGTCLNRGCIPTKILATAATAAQRSRDAERLSLKGEPAQMDWTGLKSRLTGYVEALRHDFVRHYQEHGVTLLHGEAVFVAEKTLRVHCCDSSINSEGAERILCGETIILATGAETRVPEAFIDLDYLNSERFFGGAYPGRPAASIAIVGGGSIGCEYAHIYAAAGTKVTLIQHNVRLLPKADAEISEQLLRNFQARGMRVLLNQDIRTCVQEKTGFALRLQNRASGETTELRTDGIFLASGVRPCTDGLGLEKAGVLLDPRGFIRVNECMETSVPGIYALGDVTGPPMLRHKANYEAEILAENLYGIAPDGGELPNGRIWRRAFYGATPQVTYSEPEVAQLGLSEAEALERGYAIRLGRRRYSEQAKGYAMGYRKGDVDDGLVKVVTEAGSGRILGVHIIGAEASLLMQGYAYLMNASPHEIPVRDPELGASAACAAARTAKPELPVAASIQNILTSMTAHPALSETAAWVFQNMSGVEEA